jgi:hypothetical protein
MPLPFRLHIKIGHVETLAGNPYRKFDDVVAGSQSLL